jgi:carbonic anhydrase
MTHDSDSALRFLREGNLRFTMGMSDNRYTPASRTASLEGQAPFAVIIGCSDSRVPVEAVFDAGIGELFVVRTAGHVLSAAGLASVRFAVEKLGTRAVVVLGHEDCGAVAAALSGDTPDWLEPIVSRIDLNVVNPGAAPEDADDPVLAAAVDAHVIETVNELREWCARFDLPEGQPTIVGAAYKLATGEVHWLD